jgi:predicted NBD/HSP70 family sugar kinase
LHEAASKALINEWVDDAAQALAMAIISAQSVLDLDHVVMDGGLPSEILKQLIEKTRTDILAYNTEGIDIPDIVLGELGNDARALGAAMLPLRANFSVDQSAFVIGH